MANFIIIIILAAAVILAARYLVKRKKAGIHSCGGNCSGCSGCPSGELQKSKMQELQTKKKESGEQN